MSKAKRRKEKRAARDEAVNAQRATAKQKRRKKLLFTWSIVIVALALIIFGFLALAERPSKYDDFAQCLTKAEFTMYGTDWCNHCQDQKRLFGRSFKEVDYVNCDQSQECALKGIDGYPTWIFPDGTEGTGVQSLEFLAQKSGCSLPE